MEQQVLVQQQPWHLLHLRRKQPRPLQLLSPKWLENVSDQTYIQNEQIVFFHLQCNHLIIYHIFFVYIVVTLFMSDSATDDTKIIDMAIVVDTYNTTGSAILVTTQGNSKRRKRSTDEDIHTYGGPLAAGCKYGNAISII